MCRSRVRHANHYTTKLNINKVFIVEQRVPQQERMYKTVEGRDGPEILKRGLESYTDGRNGRMGYIEDDWRIMSPAI